MHKLNLAGILLLSGFVFAVDGPPQIYQPTYIYGATPAYMGDMYGIGNQMDPMYLPNGEGMKEMQTQSGEQEQSFQFIQGQEQLMHDHSQQALKAYNQEQVIGKNMQQQYMQQIDQQTHQAIQLPVSLPNM